MRKPKPDVQVENHFTLYLFRLLTDEAEGWASRNVQPDAQFFGGALVVEHRYARNLAAGMAADGLVLQ